MQFDVVAGIASSPRKFPVHHLPDGTACVAGTAPDQKAPDGSELVVFSPKGGRTTAHPGTEPYEALYEVHPGDFIGVLNRNSAISLNAYMVLRFEDDYAIGVPAAL